MTRAPGSAAALRWMAAGAVFGIACSDTTTTPITQLNLDRPVDVAFACYGDMRLTNGGTVNKEQQPLLTTAQPPAACAALSPSLADDVPRHVNDKITLATGQDNPDDASAPFPIRPAWYAFILQSASGTVALATWPAMPADTMGPNGSISHDMAVIDADRLTPGKNAISIGEDPIAIATDKAGCFEVTANAGSCDLSELEINSLLGNLTVSASNPAKPVRVDRVPVKNANGITILARPAAMVAEPSSTVVGNVCPAVPDPAHPGTMMTAATGRVYIAYPSCHLVAGVDVSTGTIVAGIKYDVAGALGVPTILSGAELAGVVCPDECSKDGGKLGMLTPGVRPVALDLRFDPRVGTSRLAIGSDIGASNAAPVTIVRLDPVTADPVSGPQSPLPVTLEGIASDPLNPLAPRTPVSVTALALSPQIGMGGNAAGPKFVTDEDTDTVQGQYVYAVATDSTVRVADVLNVPKECDTQIDGRFLQGALAAELHCLAIGSRPRRSGARGPGIELPGTAVPNSVAILKGRTAPIATMNTTTNVVDYQLPSPSTWLGYFAIITSSNGVSYVVNVDDDYARDEPDAVLADNLDSSPVLVMAHQLRDNFVNRNGNPQATITNPAQTVPSCVATDPLLGAGLGGGPRASAPTQTSPTGTLGSDKLVELPKILNALCEDGGQEGNHALKQYSVSEVEFTAPRSVRAQVFPDLRTVISETWYLIWEGILSIDGGNQAVDGPPIRGGSITVDSIGMHLKDPAHPFCDIGVETFDIADLRGCDPSNKDGDCPRGYTCYVHPNYVNPPNGPSVGACMLQNEGPRLADACRDFLTTRRRYTVGGVKGGEVVLLERKHELSMTPVDGCDDSNNDYQCNALAQDAARIDASADPFTARTHWSCQTDPLRAPISSDAARNKRCIQVCSTDPTDPSYPYDCASGTVCRAVNPANPSDHRGICLEGVEPPQACLNGPQRYDVRAGEAFTVIGTVSGYVHPWVEKSDGTCVRPADSPTGPGPVQIGRIPLRVPACALPPGDNTGRLPGGGFDANPCSLSTMQYDNVSPDPVACDGVPTTSKDASGNPLFASRSVPAIKFRNRAMTLTIVDPYRTCQLPGTPEGIPSSLPNIPFVVTGYQLDFALRGGYSPTTHTLQSVGAASPVKVVRGPTESIWVIDAGDFLSSSLTQPSTRGLVYRVETVSPLNPANVLR